MGQKGYEWTEKKSQGISNMFGSELVFRRSFSETGVGRTHEVSVVDEGWFLPRINVMGRRSLNNRYCNN